jgi:hypothetical protein
MTQKSVMLTVFPFALLYPACVSQKEAIAAADAVSTHEAKVVSTYEAAQIKGCTPDNIRRLRRAGLLRPVISTGAGHLFRRTDVERLAREPAEKSADAPSPKTV